MKGKKNRKMHYFDATAYCEPGKDPIVFYSKTNGKMSHKKSGIYGWELDYIFIVDGCKRTMANYPDEKRLRLLNNRHILDLIKHLSNIKKR